MTQKKTDDKCIAIWMQQIRAPFLVLSVALSLIGIAAAQWDGFTQWGQAALLTLGVILSHIGVNLFNELSDFKTGIDAHTERTPFSGGSGMMQAGKTTPGAVKMAAYGALILAGLIGLYFCLISTWYILIFMIIGGLTARFYTSHLAKWLIGEFMSGLTLGTFVVLGVYLAMTGTLHWGIVWVSIPPGILTSLLLFLNEFPDEKADRTGGRHHLIIHFGKAWGARVYVLSLAATYLIILLGPFMLDIPYLVLIALLTLPVAMKAGLTALKYHNDMPRLAPALGMNVMTVIGTDLLLAVGFFLAGPKG